MNGRCRVCGDRIEAAQLCQECRIDLVTFYLLEKWDRLRLWFSTVARMKR